MESPFIPGARVAMRDGGRWGAARWQSFEVEKRFKNGRFTLKGREGQWNECPPSGREYEDQYWHAYRAGSNRYGDGTLFIWNDESSAFINEGYAAMAREKRLKMLQHRFEQRLRYGDVTDAALDAIEAALPPTSNKP